MNNWAEIKRFYDEHRAHILSEPPDEWAIPAYSWDPLVNMTPIEGYLWEDIRDANVVMYPQWPALGVFLDFANPAAMVAIECDGHAYYLDKARDAARDAKLSASGWTIYRIPGYDCATSYDEETGELGEGRKFIDRICEVHPIKRLRRGSGWVRAGQSDMREAA